MVKEYIYFFYMQDYDNKLRMANNLVIKFFFTHTRSSKHWIGIRFEHFLKYDQKFAAGANIENKFKKNFF